jgi:hypothetical protein
MTQEGPLSWLGGRRGNTKQPARANLKMSNEAEVVAGVGMPTLRIVDDQ